MIVFKTSNRAILLLLSLVLYIGENIYFGWNKDPMSFAELWMDNFCIILMVFGLFVKKLWLVVSTTRRDT